MTRWCGGMFGIAPGDDQRMVGGRRLLRQHVDAGPGEAAAGDGGGNGRYIDDVAARGVDQVRAAGHFFD